MGEQRTGRKDAAFFCWAVKACLIGFLFPAIVPPPLVSAHHKGCAWSVSVCEAGQNEELFTVDVAKQKEAIAKEFERIDDILFVQAKLQDSRGALDVLEHKLDRLRKSLAKDEWEAFRARLEKARKAIPAKEDSLVNKTIEIMYKQSVEAALQYTQNDLRLHGVSDSKIVAIEKRVLEEAPAVKQSQEREQIARVLKILESGQLPDSSFDPYIIRTAQLMIKAHEDSLKRIENSKKRKEIEEQERVERAQMEKEMKEKKAEEERLAKQRKEDEKKNALEQAAQRKRLEAEEKEKQHQAGLDEERRKKELAAQKDSIAQEEKKSARIAQLQRASKERIEDTRERKQNDKDQRQGGAVTTADSSAQVKEKTEAAQRIRDKQAAQAEEARMKQRTAQQEKDRKDSIEQRKKAEVEAVVRQQQAQQLLAQQEKAKNGAPAKQEKTPAASIEKQGASPQPEKGAPVAPAAQESIQPLAQQPKAVVAAPQPARFQPDSQQPRPIDKTAQAYLQSLQDNRKDAQKKVMAIYDLVEQKQGKAALETFKQNRAYIGKYVEAQVFTILEQTVLQSVMEVSPVAAAAADSQAPAASSPKKITAEQECYNKINGYLRDNKVDAAYSEFKRGEKQLRNVMTKAEFKQLKKMVENAYKTRHPGK